MRLIFNVGARRSGTYWLQRIICAHPAVAEVPSETYLFSHGIAPLMERFQHDEPASPEMGQVFARRERVLPRVRALCDTIFEEFAEPGHTHVAERTPWHVYHLPLIAEVYPDARFVHIVRDGRDVAWSIVAQPWEPHTVAEAAAEWRSSVEAGRAAAAALGEGVLEVRHEDLAAAPRECVTRLYGHLGLHGELERGVAAAEQRVNVSTHDERVRVRDWEANWGRRELRDFERAAGDLLRELGYAQGAGVSAG